MFPPIKGIAIKDCITSFKLPILPKLLVILSNNIEKNIGKNKELIIPYMNPIKYKFNKLA